MFLPSSAHCFIFSICMHSLLSFAIQISSLLLSFVLKSYSGASRGREMVFPPGCVESTPPNMMRRKKYTKVDVQPVEGWKVVSYFAPLQMCVASNIDLHLLLY